MCKIIFSLYLFLLILKMSSSYSYDTIYFKQKVDHFSYENEDYFLQRYLVNKNFWNSTNGVIFFYTGNEGDIEMFANNTGFMWEHAEKFNAMLVFAEHRYYGLSLPYGDESYSDNKYRGYLSSEQALADFATLISYLRSSIHSSKYIPVIAFGGSYGGMLAAWIRMKYPHLVDGALASSAPVLQFADLTPCGKFSEIVTNDFSKAGYHCSKSIKKSWKAIRRIGSTERGAKWLSTTFNLCENVNSSELNQLIDWLSSTWSNMAMTDYPYPTNFLLPLPAYPINKSCEHLIDETVTDKQLMINIVKAASVFQNYTGSVQCFNLSQPGGKTLGAYGWDFQACTEMVMPMCQQNSTDMFEPSPWNFTAYSEQCQSKWQVTPDLYKAIIMYGGKNISMASNIIFSNGDLDPWSAGGILQSISESLIAIQIKGAAHHLDLRESNDADPPSVVKARITELRWISKWIQEAKKIYM